MVATIVSGSRTLLEVARCAERDNLLGDDAAGETGEDDDPGLGRDLAKLG